MTFTRRGLEVTGFVALWVALGWILRLGPNEYLLLGIPLTAGFQLLLRRRPLRELWVRDASALRVDLPVVALAGVLAVVPLFRLMAIPRPELSWIVVGWHICAIVGALGAAWALRQFRRDTFRSLLLCIATAGTAGILLMLLAYGTRESAAELSARSWLEGAQWLLLYLPVAFILEEVTFRGALDSHVHEPVAPGNPGSPSPLFSAFLVAALWGVWHLPLIASAAGSFLPVQIAMLVATHVIIGVPLALWWRRSGNLAVVALTHALINAVRNVLLG